MQGKGAWSFLGFVCHALLIPLLYLSEDGGEVDSGLEGRWRKRAGEEEETVVGM